MLTPPSAPPPPAPPAPRRARGPLLVAAAALVVAAGLAVWGLVALVAANGERDDARRAVAVAQARTAGSDAAAASPVARARDEVSASAGKAVAVLNTMDHRTLDEDLAAWAEVTTGSLREEITALAESQRQQVVDARTTTDGQVVLVAVRELDTEVGTATALVALKVTRSAGGAEPAADYRRFEATLDHTTQGWKLSGITDVPYAEPGR